MNHLITYVDVATVVMNKCIDKSKRKDGSYSVTYTYEFLDDNDEDDIKDDKDDDKDGDEKGKDSHKR